LAIKIAMPKHGHTTKRGHTNFSYQNFNNFRIGKNPNYTLELSQKSDFQPSTTKPNNISHPTIEIKPDKFGP